MSIVQKATWRAVMVALALMPLMALSQKSKKKRNKEKGWIAASNRYTSLLLDIDKKYSPEFGSAQGLAEYDTLISVPSLLNDLKQRSERSKMIDSLQKLFLQERDPMVKQDLAILIRQTELNIKLLDFDLNRKVPLYNPTEAVFDGIKVLLDDQTPIERRAAAIVRLKKYAAQGIVSRPLASIYQNRTEMQMKKAAMIYPAKQEIEIALSRNPSIIEGMETLFKKYKLTGWEENFKILKIQLQQYDAFIRSKVLPKARADYKMPGEEYKMAMESFGVDIPVVELDSMAHTAFNDIQKQMQTIAEQVAQKYHLPGSDYRDVIRFLKKDQIIGDSILPLYERRLKEIEEIIRREKLVTLPEGPAFIKLATAAETAQSPAPHMVPPPFLNNTGQRGVFVLPLNMPPAPGEKTDKYDDFTFDAAAWTIIAHEARPGHEMQFDKMVEEGVSQARSLYAFNSANVEGWGLYSEYITLPYMPIEGQLISLDYRLLRAARAFLDPELQNGTTTPSQALELLMKEVVQSHAFAQQEVERYTVKMPGQATSYFYGFTQMLALRKDAEAALGSKFDAQRFHDFVLSQGILPPALIREAVFNTFIPKEK
ncbi:Uncharacterized conserved protein, DUF885 familyt [Filimonas lacunae]|uniref:Uncharacterized conserved protein, DUF885 familyt n=1 Tax=Filimonas lacunae TaxID=477680 RepID=A0A173MFY8_9BACT|nr:DUF885 domain-containing protein [Filimonas lacunae]BAV06544.1 hypothetical protein FLA_2563 [Filimonas lacunae]SIT27333.1 Uncharacterized conserved protein, DUF885 familyt [Filimonas lacunae]